jgi:peptidoglycan lytic transglycosylase
MQTVPLGAGGAIPRLFCYPARAGRRWLAAGLVAGGVLLAVGSAHADATPVAATTGDASWYGGEFADRPTASGERYDPAKLTGAHRTLPLGSKVRVTNLHNGRSVLVTINDRGPYARRRSIDLSYGAARALGMLRRGVARVRIELVES